MRCGRILRPLAELCRTTPLSPDPIQWYGTDIDAQTISWCQRHLGSIGKFVLNDIRPPLPFRDQFFDFVFSISIFTHLPEDMQFGWLKDINRVLKTGRHGFAFNQFISPSTEPEGGEADGGVRAILRTASDVVAQGPCAAHSDISTARQK
jgi:ubiquinone/menaquinone biosynthesis C-methylase UbiE